MVCTGWPMTLVELVAVGACYLYQHTFDGGISRSNDSSDALLDVNMHRQLTEPIYASALSVTFCTALVNCVNKPGLSAEAVRSSTLWVKSLTVFCASQSSPYESWISCSASSVSGSDPESTFCIGASLIGKE